MGNTITRGSSVTIEAYQIQVQTDQMRQADHITAEGSVMATSGPPREASEEVRSTPRIGLRGLPQRWGDSTSLEY